MILSIYPIAPSPAVNMAGCVGFGSRVGAGRGTGDGDAGVKRRPVLFSIPHSKLHIGLLNGRWVRCILLAFSFSMRHKQLRDQRT